MPKTVNAAAHDLIAAVTLHYASTPEPVIDAAGQLGKALARARKAQSKGGRKSKSTGRPPSVDREAVRAALTRHSGNVAAVVAEGIASEGTVRAIRRGMQGLQ